MKTLEDCNKIQYISNRRKHHFYKKIDFLYFRTVEMSWLKKFLARKVLKKLKLCIKKLKMKNLT